MRKFNRAGIQEALAGIDEKFLQPFFVAPGSSGASNGGPAADHEAQHQLRSQAQRQQQQQMEMQRLPREAGPLVSEQQPWQHPPALQRNSSTEVTLFALLCLAMLPAPVCRSGQEIRVCPDAISGQPRLQCHSALRCDAMTRQLSPRFAHWQMSSDDASLLRNPRVTESGLRPPGFLWN